MLGFKSGLCRAIYDQPKITRRLATANRSRVSIRVDPAKSFITSGLTTMQNVGCCFLYCVPHVAGHKNLGDAEAPPPRAGGMADP